MKNKDVRKLQQSIRDNFPAILEDQLSGVIGGKGNVIITKYASRTLVYSVDNIPYFFDVAGRTEIFPTVFALWHFASIMRCVVIHVPVSEFLLKGADLMLPGVVDIEDLPSLEEGEKVCIRVLGNPLPFAVGKSEVSGENVINGGGLCGGAKGKAVSVVHTFGDCLWSSVRRVGVEETVCFPNPGFMRQLHRVEGVQQDEGGDGEEGSGDEKASCEEQQQHEDMRHGGVRTESIVESSDDMDRAMLVCTLRALKYILKDRDLPLLVSSLWSTVCRCALPGEPTLTVRRSSFGKVSSFLEHLHGEGLLEVSGIGDGVGELVCIQRQHDHFKTHKESVRVDCPEEFRAMILGFGSPSQTGSGVLRVFELYKLPRPMNLALSTVEGAFGVCFTGREIQELVIRHITERSLTHPEDERRVLIPVDDPLHEYIRRPACDKKQKPLHRVDQDKPIVDAAGREKSDCEYDDENEELDDENEEHDARDSWGGYTMVAGVLLSSSLPGGVRQQNSQSTSKWKPIDLPPPPPQHIHTQKVRTPAEPPVELDISKEDLMARVRAKLTPYHAIVLPSGESSVSVGRPPSVRIEVQKRMGNKVVTRVRHLEAYGLHPKLCAKDFQKRFACSTTLSAVPGKSTDMEIIVQGNWMHQLETFISEDCGIPKKYVETSSAIKTKKGK